MNMLEAVRRVAPYAGKNQALQYLRVGGDAVAASGVTGGCRCDRVEDIDRHSYGVSVHRIAKVAALMSDAAVARDRSSVEICGVAGVFRLPTVDLDMTPKMPAPPKKWLTPPEGFLSAIDRVAWARSRDATRPHLAGIVIEPESIFASDGHVAAVVSLPSLIDVGRSALAFEAFHGLESPEVSVTTGEIWCRSDDESRWARRGPQAPDLMKLLPMQPSATADVSREDLTGAVSAALIVAGKHGRLDLMAAITDLKIAATDEETGAEYHHKIEAVVSGKRKASINPVFLHAALRCAEGDRVQIGFGDTELDMVHLIDGAYHVLIAPIRPE